MRAVMICVPVRVALFLTCMNDTLFPETGIATVQVLERLGHEVVFPEPQTCCGGCISTRATRRQLQISRVGSFASSPTRKSLSPHRLRAWQLSASSTPTWQNSSMTRRSENRLSSSRPE